MWRIVILVAVTIGVSPHTAAIAQQGGAAISPSRTTEAIPSSMQGEWAGPVTQSPPGKAYAVILKMGPGGGETDYRELDCGGQLTLIRFESGVALLTETITRGRIDNGGTCLDGDLTLALIDGRLRYEWSGLHEGARISARSTLDRR